MESHEEPPESDGDIGKAVEKTLEEVNDEVPRSDVKVRIRIEDGEIVETSAQYREKDKTKIIIAAGAASLTAAGILAAYGYHQYRRRKK